MNNMLGKEIVLLDEMILDTFFDDNELNQMIIHSRHINNTEMIEVLRDMIRVGDKDGAKRLILSL